MPRIFAYVHAYVPDHNAGAETTLHDILKYLVAQGWDADVVLKYSGYLEPREYEIDGVHVVQPSDKKRAFLGYLPKADVTISHLEMSNHTHLTSEAYKVPTVHLVHNTHPLTIGWLQRANGLIVNTEWIANEPEIKSLPLPKMVLNPPVNPREYETVRGKSVTLVNLWDDKGAKVFYELARRNPDIQFLGVIGGYGAQVIEELPNVKILEHTKDMKKVYGETKVLLMPSKYESFGRVGVEGMASGIPTIAHPTPGLKESLGDSGTFVDRDDLDAWNDALRAILKPAKYGKASKLALARSKTLEERREIQLGTVPMFLKELIRTRTGKVL